MNPLTHLNFWLGIIKSTQPLTDKVIQSDPYKPAALFLPYEKAAKSILRLRDRSNTIGMPPSDKAIEKPHIFI